MGTGIAEACAKTGLDVILGEVNEAVAETARARVQHLWTGPYEATSSAPRRPRRRSPA